jgi:hypothetical protein
MFVFFLIILFLEIFLLLFVFLCYILCLSLSLYLCCFFFVLKKKYCVHLDVLCSLSRREESCQHKLFVCLLACMSAEGQKNIRVDRRVIGVEELEYEVSFLKLFYGTIFLDKGPLFYKKIIFL